MNLLRWLLPDISPEMSAAGAEWAQAGAAVITLAIAAYAVWISTHDLRATKIMLEAQTKSREEQSRPRVILDRAAGQVLARNVGLGAALNAFHLQALDAVDDIEPLGSVLPGTDVRVYEGLHDKIGNEVREMFDRRPHYIVAQSAVSDEWVMSINRVNANGAISHEFVAWAPTANQMDAMKRLSTHEHIAQALAAYRAADAAGDAGGPTGGAG